VFIQSRYADSQHTPLPLTTTQHKTRHEPHQATAQSSTQTRGHPPRFSNAPIAGAEGSDTRHLSRTDETRACHRQPRRGSCVPTYPVGLRVGLGRIELVTQSGHITEPCTSNARLCACVWCFAMWRWVIWHWECYMRWQTCPTVMVTWPMDLGRGRGWGEYEYVVM
jgi:hypothetical protein